MARFMVSFGIIIFFLSVNIIISINMYIYSYVFEHTTLLYYIFCITALCVQKQSHQTVEFSQLTFKPARVLSIYTVVEAIMIILLNYTYKPSKSRKTSNDRVHIYHCACCDNSKRIRSDQ